VLPWADSSADHQPIGMHRSARDPGDGRRCQISRGRDLLLNLYGCLLAQACNLGFKPLADAAALPYNKLLSCNRWYVRDETLAEATTTLVTFMQSLPYSGVWGSGLLSSSDGQRFAAKGNIRKARALPRYYGYGKGVTFYTWTLDLFAQYGSKAIPSTVRDATFVLDALLDNLADLEVVEHTTDTAGYTELIFALFDLLGFKFSPRIRDLGDQQLYRTAELDLSALPKMRAQLTGVVNEIIICEDWDEMLRLALSLKKGYVTASLIVQKLQAYPRKHPLMRSLQEYGRLIKTLHILSWYEDLALRQRISKQLNKGEALHRLREHIFYGKHGELAGMEDEPLDHVVGCLNLVANIVVVWNAVQMAKLVDDLRLEGVIVRDEDLARIWPTRFDHLNVIGRYHFDVAQIRTDLP
jgi:TnpA family transposase